MNDLALLIANLQSTDASTRVQAAEELATLGEECQQAIVPLTQACSDESEEVREAATAALEESGPPAPTDLPALIGLLRAPQTECVYWAVTLLGRLEEEAADAIESLADLLSNHPDLAIRERAAWALGRMGPAAAPALEILEQAAKSEHVRLARLAGAAIEQIET